MPVTAKPDASSVVQVFNPDQPLLCPRCRKPLFNDSQKLRRGKLIDAEETMRCDNATLSGRCGQNVFILISDDARAVAPITREEVEGLKRMLERRREMRKAIYTRPVRS